MPKMKLTVKGRGGNKYVVELDPWDYIVAEQTYKLEIIYEKFEGRSYATGWERKSKKIWACAAAFATMDFPTRGNGPAWIFGLPVFYSHRVSYNVDHTPPSMSFTRESCGSCSKAHRAMPRWKNSLSKPRKLHGPPRLPQRAERVKL